VASSPFRCWSLPRSISPSWSSSPCIGEPLGEFRAEKPFGASQPHPRHAIYPRWLQCPGLDYMMATEIILLSETLKKSGLATLKPPVDILIGSWLPGERLASIRNRCLDSIRPRGMLVPADKRNPGIAWRDEWLIFDMGQ